VLPDIDPVCADSGTPFFVLRYSLATLTTRA
jgi:hypothetical protein